MNRRVVGGYILLEAIGALAVLSVGIFGIHQAMRQAILTRGQARDYTQARFLLEERLGELMVQPVLQAGTSSGSYDGDLSRFSWATRVTRVNLSGDAVLPAPVPGTLLPAEPAAATESIGKIEVTIAWTRQGRRFSAKAETLVAANRISEPLELQNVQ